MTTNTRAIMERVAYERFEKNVENAAKKIGSWTGESVVADVKAAEQRLAADLQAIDWVMKQLEES